MNVQYLENMLMNASTESVCAQDGQTMEVDKGENRYLPPPPPEEYWMGCRRGTM